MAWQHGAHGYRTYGCRCDICTTASTDRARDERAARYAKRIMVAGVPVAVRATTPHGAKITYSNWGCRCTPCTDANTSYFRDYKARRNARAIAEVPS